MTRFAPYTSYSATQASGVHEIPSHWQSKRLRYTCSINPKAMPLDLPPDALVSFVPMEAVGEYGGLSLDQERAADQIGAGYTYFENNDVVIAKITPCFENGKGALAEGLTNGAAFGTTELHVLRSGLECDARFLFYLSISDHFRKIGESEMYGAGGQKRIPDSFIKDFRSALPPLNEQRMIVSFLDTETQRLTKLIGRKRSLLELTEEKRLAIISRAVTKGVRTSAPIKESGVEWLGQMPAHWTSTNIKRCLISLRDGTHNPPPRANGEYRLLSARNIIDGKFIIRDDDRTMELEAFDELQRSYDIQHGDVVVAIVGATTGKSAVVENIERCTVQRSIAILRPNLSVIDARYLNYWITANIFQSLM